MEETEFSVGKFSALILISKVSINLLSVIELPMGVIWLLLNILALFLIGTGAYNLFWPMGLGYNKL